MAVTPVESPPALVAGLAGHNMVAPVVGEQLAEMSARPATETAHLTKDLSLRQMGLVRIAELLETGSLVGPV